MSDEMEIMREFDEKNWHCKTFLCKKAERKWLDDAVKRQVKRALQSVRAGADIHRMIAKYSPAPIHCAGMQEAIEEGAYEKHGNQFYAVMRYRCGNPHKILTDKCIYCPKGKNCVGDNK